MSRTYFDVRNCCFFSFIKLNVFVQKQCFPLLKTKIISGTTEDYRKREEGVCVLFQRLYNIKKST